MGSRGTLPRWTRWNVPHRIVRDPATHGRAADTDVNKVKQLRESWLQEVSALPKALGSVQRLQLIEFLAQRERSVEVLAELAGISVSNASQHLSMLRRVGLVTTRRESQFIHYRLVSDDVVRLTALMTRMAMQFIPGAIRVQQSLASAGDVDGEDSVSPEHRLHRRGPECSAGDVDGEDSVSPEALIEAQRKHPIQVIDVRPADEYDTCCIRGAISMPLETLSSRKSDLSTEHVVVAYCRSAHCLLSSRAVAMLREAGFRAHRLAIGLPEWRVLGLPVTDGPGARHGYGAASRPVPVAASVRVRRL
jgi:rhodanese-related sulfurtransferase/DNA-binding transcriptional ArsR family regulator